MPQLDAPDHTPPNKDQHDAPEGLGLLSLMTPSPPPQSAEIFANVKPARFTDSPPAIAIALGGATAGAIAGRLSSRTALEFGDRTAWSYKTGSDFESAGRGMVVGIGIGLIDESLDEKIGKAEIHTVYQPSMVETALVGGAAGIPSVRLRVPAIVAAWAVGRTYDYGWLKLENYVKDRVWQ